MSFRELWRLSSTFLVFLTACVRKICRLRAPVTWAVCHDTVISVLPADKVPDRAIQVLKPLVEDFQRLGCDLAFYHTVPSSENLEAYAAVLLPCERDAVIGIAWSRFSRPGRKGRRVCSITSRLQDGTLLSTTTWDSSTDRPPGFRVLRWPKATPAELSRRHREALAESSALATRVRDAEDAKELLLEGKRRKFEWNVGRGVYLPLTTVEQAQLGLPPEGNS